MPGPDQLIRVTLGLPWAIAKRVVGLLPFVGDDARIDDRPAASVPDRDEAAAAAEDALERERDPREEPIFTPDDDFFDDDHVESEVEVVAESADPEVDASPGPQLHVDEPWEGYRRMKVAEIVTRLDGQPSEVLAAVELYESTHRKRRGVLEAVESATRA